MQRIFSCFNNLRTDRTLSFLDSSRLSLSTGLMFPTHEKRGRIVSRERAQTSLNLYSETTRRQP